MIFGPVGWAPPPEPLELDLEETPSLEPAAPVVEIPVPAIINIPYGAPGIRCYLCDKPASVIADYGRYKFPTHEGCLERARSAGAK